MLVLGGCTKKEADINIKIPNDYQGRDNLHSRVDGKTLLGLASYKEFETSRKVSARKLAYNAFGTNLVDGEDEVYPEYPTYSYPFDFIKIHSATKYEIYIPEDSEDTSLEALKMSTGLGNLEVIIANFTTYIVNDYSEYMSPSVTDTMISIKGSRGFYTILNNSGASGNNNNFDDGHFYSVFSSHKIITSEEIEKNFEPPIYCIMFEKTNDGKYYLAFKVNEIISSVHDFYYDDSLVRYEIPSSTIENVSRDTLYNIQELVKVDEATQSVQIVAIDIENKVIEVISETSLRYVYVDDFTEFDSEYENILDILIIGANVLITYDVYFEGYDPIGVYANSILFE